jgi:hypothetical protein
MGVERYGNRFFAKDFLTPELFEKERFFDLQEGDTFYPDLVTFSDYYSTSVEGYDEAVYFGDKIPLLYKYFDRLQTNFPDCKTLFIFRNIFDVAASYKARKFDKNDNWKKGVKEAISDWNEGFECAQAYKGRILYVDYEELFLNGSGVDKIYRFLELDVTDETEAQVKKLLARSAQLEQERSRALTAMEVKEICETADFESYRTMVKAAVK